jgi:hypothetical protein
MIEIEEMEGRKPACSVYGLNPYVCKIYQTAAISWSLCSRTQSSLFIYIHLKVPKCEIFDLFLRLINPTGVGDSGIGGKLVYFED